jgi:hypothetical protein
MILSPALAMASLMQAMPCEYVIDFGPPTVVAESRVEIVLLARDGTARKLRMVFGGKMPSVSKPEADRAYVAYVLNDNGWQARPGPGATLIVTGTKKGSPVRSVTVKSEAAVPTVRWVPLPPRAGPGPKK